MITPKMFRYFSAACALSFSLATCWMGAMGRWPEFWMFGLGTCFFTSTYIVVRKGG